MMAAGIEFTLFVLATLAAAAVVGGLLRVALPKVALRGAAIDLAVGEAGVRRSGMECATWGMVALTLLSLALVLVRG